MSFERIEIEMVKNWVLIRGIVSEEFHWWDFLPQMRTRFPKSAIFTADILGNGKTFQQKTPLSVHSNVQALRQQVPAREKKILFGFSLGGMLAAEWAFRHPEEVEALVLVNTSFRESLFFRRLTPSALIRIFQMGRQKSHLDREKMTLSLTTQLSISQIEEIAEHWGPRGALYPIRTENFFRQLIVGAQVSRRNPPPFPVLVLSSANDRVVHPSCSRKIARSWKVPWVEHPDAGHDVTLEDPQWVLEQIENWLGRLKIREPLVDDGRDFLDDLKSPHRRDGTSEDVHGPVGP